MKGSFGSVIISGKIGRAFVPEAHAGSKKVCAIQQQKYEN
jgi:hypothetical protein